MAQSIWSLSLLLSDGRSPCSRSTASGTNLDQLLRGLTAGLRPPLPTGSRPVWMRLDGRAPDRRPERMADLQAAMQRTLLPHMGIDRPPQMLDAADGEELRLWLDLSRAPVSSQSPLIEAQERARAWLLRLREQQGSTSEEPALLLATLLLVRGDSDRPDLEMAIHGLTRVVLEQCGQALSCRDAARVLAVLAAQLGKRTQRHLDLPTACRELQRSVLRSIATRSTAATVSELFSLALTQAAGIAEPGSSRPLDQLTTGLQAQPRASTAARCAALLGLVVLAENGARPPAFSLEQIQAMADLSDPGQVRDGSTALRAVLLLRLWQILGVSPADAATTAAWRSAATAVVLGQQCTASEAIAAADPQRVLGAFGGCRGGPASLTQQLVPLMTLHHLLLLPSDHASD